MVWLAPVFLFMSTIGRFLGGRLEEAGLPPKVRGSCEEALSREEGWKF